MKRSLLTALMLLCVAPAVARADLPSWLRKKNGDVTDGNDLLARGDAKGALAAYDSAARELPSDAGVQLNRGLALLKLGELNKAKEALLTAAAPAAPSQVRADAYQNLALAHYREADTLAGQSKHDEAQKAFRESVDAAKRSLRLRPGDPNAAWNLELAARRMREEEAKHKEQQEKQKQEQEQKDEQDQNQDGQNQDGQQDQQPQDQNGDQQKPDDGAGDKQDPKDGQKPEDQAKDGDKDKQAQDEAQKKAAEQQKKADAQKQAQKAAEAGKQDKAQQGKEALPADMAHALDALQDGEENFERVRARQRAQQERRAPEKDW